MINVTKTFFPPIEEYNALLKRVWENQWLTNRGELLLELEAKLKEYLCVNNIIVMTNGTLPIQIALKLLGRQGEIITTPFSYVATTSSIVWENCTPVFVDIDPEHLTIDENKIEAAITSKTTAILATHVFGNPCNVDKIEEIAKKYNLKIIYDAAHCFGITYNNKSIFEYGDVSTCSFHATKVFHTGEGGAVFCNDKDLQHKIFYSHAFGHLGPTDYYGVGINAKISELQAAMGLAVLPYIKDIFTDRKRVVDLYCSGLNFLKIKRIKVRENSNSNYSYFPVIFESEEVLLKVVERLNAYKIFPRRYFYPSLNTLNYLNYVSMPISESIALRVLCLPLYVDLQIDQIETIVKVIKETI